MPLLDRQRLAVIDVETSGRSLEQGHSVIEVARVMIENGAVVDSWSSMVGPPRPIDADAKALHGISAAMLEGAPEPFEASEQLFAGCESLPLVFHDAAFDLAFVAATRRSCGLPPLHHPVIDTLGLARGLLLEGDHGLAELAERLGLPPEPAHRALADAMTTARILIALAPRWEKERGIHSIAELAAASQDALRVTRRAAPARPLPVPVTV